MMKVIDHLTKSFARLPGIGPKSARRLAYYMLQQDDDFIDRFIDALMLLKETVSLCPLCGYYSEESHCPICNNSSRNQALICVVATIQDAVNIENSGSYDGLYHILTGLLAPLDGVGPEQLTIKALEARLANAAVTELILATPLTMEGDATAIFLQKQFASQPNLKISRIASGLPIGSDISYVDKSSLSQSLKSRHQFD